MERLLVVWRTGCAFVDGPDGHLVTIAFLVGLAIVLLRAESRLRARGSS